MKPPLIGITAGNNPKVPGSYVLRWDYVRSIEHAGGLPLILAPTNEALHATLVDRLDGLVLTGGMDVDPSYFGQPLHPKTERVSRERDEFEMLISRKALAENLPVLGICRGCQLLNVVLGGSLIQDIPSCTTSKVSHDDENRPRNAFAHNVKIDPGSRLHRILKVDEAPVNSFHHQAIERLADPLIATAWSDDGLIEAVELTDARFCVAVQWHPEAFWNDGNQFDPLFRAFVNEASKFRGKM